MVTDVAFGTLQESVEVPPSTIVEGEDEKDEPATVGQADTVTVVCNCIAAHEPAPLAVNV